MDVVGSEIGQKMRSAIKAKLTELGCYVDDELPDYVMVMVANKRTQLQMEDDLQLFLGDNTESFVNWLHQVLKKLQEVTVAVPLKNDREKQKERSVSKERKSKEKKEKSKKSDVVKKSKKKEKEKEKTNKKEEKKLHKSKKEKKKSHERIRPNIPPLLMNMEKESEPSITDVFAGQILKNHGVSLESYKDDLKVIESKHAVQEVKRPILPIIDPATILSQPEANSDQTTKTSNTAPSNSQLKEINDIEAKIQGLKQKLVEQLDSMSDDEDFLNIRTEAEELMNDFADDVLQEISQPPVATTPILAASPIPKTPTEPPKPSKRPQTPPKEIPKDPIETLPQIELNLPKRPIRERLGAREIPKKPDVKETQRQKSQSPESFTPERELDSRPQTKSARSRLGSQSESHRRISDDSPERTESSSKRITSKVSVLERPRISCASVVRVRPRPRAPASNLLLRAVADAHKSLLNIPPKVDPEPQKIKRALVLPMRRCVDAKNIVIQVDRQTDENICRDFDSGSKSSHRHVSDKYKEDFSPLQITKRILNTEYVPSRTASQRDDSLIIETINIHNPTVDKDKDTQFIVTMDGYHPNAFLAKKLKTEGILDEDEENDKPNVPKIKERNIDTKHELELMDEDVEMRSIDETTTVDSNEKIEEESINEVVKDTDPILKQKDTDRKNESISKESSVKKDEVNKVKNIDSEKSKDSATPVINQKKRLSDTSEDSDTQVIIKKEEEKGDKRKSIEVENVKDTIKDTSPRAKKRKASPIVFDVDKKEIDRQVRERTLSASSDGHVTVSTVTNSHKYDSIPPLSQAERKIIWCRAFPLCRYGAACAFAHPRCKFLAACTRRGCVYSHSPTAPANPVPVVASHVVPVANYKTISSAIPSMCKYYPNCANPACHFYHPKPCRFGKACANKLECNFYHNDVTPKYTL